MKSIIAVLFVAGVASAFAVAPSVTDVSLEIPGDPATSVKVNYTLTGEPAVVTVDLQSKDGSGVWTTIGGERMGRLGGEANKVVNVLDTPVSAIWTPSLADRETYAAGNLRAVVKAWPTNQPPDYMTVDLRNDLTVSWFTNRVSFYESTAQFPGGFADPIYKTDVLVMRKIPAANVVWLCGSPKRQKPNECTMTAYKVKLTKDYYMGIYPCTQAQYKNVYGSLGLCSFTTLPKSPRVAFNNVTMSVLRGQSFTENPNDKTLCTVNNYYWPRDGHKVTATSVIGKLRTLCGIADIDLPTYAQWEYAARGGVGTDMPNGKDGATAANVSEVGWYTSPKAGDYEVGEKPANGFGLYDVIGTVAEACLDRGRNVLSDLADTLEPGWEPDANGSYEKSSVTVDPKGPTNSLIKNQIFAGAGWLEGSSNMLLGYRASQGVEYTDSSSGGFKGFRLCCSIEAAVK